MRISDWSSDVCSSDLELHYHASIQEQLIALSELDEAFGPSELICGWYDDLYFPAELACPKGYPQDTWDRGQREWRDCFTAHELAVQSGRASCRDRVCLFV